VPGTDRVGHLDRVSSGGGCQPGTLRGADWLAGPRKECGNVAEAFGAGHAGGLAAVGDAALSCWNRLAVAASSAVRPGPLPAISCAQALAPI